VPEAQLVEEMYDHTLVMLKDSLVCFEYEDVDLALTLKSRDRILDEMNAFTSDKLIERMAQDREHLRSYLNLMFVGRDLSGSAITPRTSARMPSTRPPLKIFAINPCKRRIVWNSPSAGVRP